MVDFTQLSLTRVCLLCGVQVFDRLSSGGMWGLMRELPVPRVSASECLTVSSQGGRDGGGRVWLGGGSSAQKRGSVTFVDPDTGAISTQVRTDRHRLWVFQCDIFATFINPRVPQINGKSEAYLQ